MADFVEAARLDEIPPGTCATIEVAGTKVALFNVEGTIWAINDSCPHEGSSLGAGKLDGNVVTCASHGWQYDVRTGQLIAAPGLKVTTYPVKVIDGAILVATDKEACRKEAVRAEHSPKVACKTHEG
jgi:nitrite reductase/ring-hydroxylating ferredoxin subunit